MAALVLALTGGSQVAGQMAGGYEFDDIRVSTPVDPETGYPDRSHARITYDLSWATPAFPGKRVCAWRVYDEDGDVVGESIETIVALQSDYVDAVYNDVAVAGDPARAEVSCGPARLDDPHGHFRSSNVRIAEKADLPTGDLAVVFLAEWRGAGDPTPQECVARLYGQSGDLLHEEARNVVAAEPSTTVSLQLEHVPASLDERPARATVRCTPLH